MDSSPAPTAPPTARPTRVRYGVLGFACALSMVTYLDRACFGVANKSIIAALGLSSIADLTYALTAFNLAYAIFEDRKSTRLNSSHVEISYAVFCLKKKKKTKKN